MSDYSLSIAYGADASQANRGKHFRDILDELFTPDVISRLKAKPEPSNTLTTRIAILTAAERADAELNERCFQRYLLARRAAWAKYVTSMRDADLLDEDVKSRLIGVDDDGFRSALSELRTPQSRSCNHSYTSRRNRSR